MHQKTLVYTMPIPAGNRPQILKSSNPRVILRHAERVLKRLPVLAIITQPVMVDQRLDLVVPLHKLNRESLLRMPNVTIYEPCTRIICLESYI